MSNIPMIIGMVLAALFLVWMGYRVFVRDDTDGLVEEDEDNVAPSDSD